MGRRGYSLEFRRRALDLIDAARDLDVSEQTFYIWRRPDRIDRCLERDTTSIEGRAEVRLARGRVAVIPLCEGWA